jgi:hypothetical protein
LRYHLLYKSLKINLKSLESLKSPQQNLVDLVDPEDLAAQEATAVHLHQILQKEATAHQGLKVLSLTLQGALVGLAHQEEDLVVQTDM